VRRVSNGRPAASNRDVGQLKTVTAQLSVTSASLARLLSVSGSQSDFILSAVDGSTTVRVGLAVSSVPDALVTIGNRGLTLDWSRSTLTLGSRRVPLTRMELRLLAALVEYAPKPAPRRHLISRMWPSLSPSSHERDLALAVWIHALRRRFASVGVRNAIVTVRNVGYCLRTG